MKKTLLTIFASIAVTGYALAQCTPTLTGPSGDIVPDTTQNLDVAFVGVDYEMVIQVYVPQDTMYDVTGTGNPTNVTIQDFTITDVVGIPAGFSYTTNPANGVFPGGSAACLQITAAGADITTALLGVHPIVVSLKVTPQGLPIQLDVDVEGYRIDVQEANGIEDILNSNTFEVAQSYPNPAGDEANIAFTTPQVETVELNIFNMLGAIVHTEKVVSESGINTFKVNTSRLSAGLYVYTVSNGTKTFTKKLTVK